MNLPPLRTIRPSPPAPGEPVSPSSSVAGPVPVPTPLPIPAELGSAKLPPSARKFLLELLELGLIEPDEVPGLLDRLGDRTTNLTSRATSAAVMVAAGVLTAYQSGRVMAGQGHGLVLGPYKVLDRLGSGTVGIVFRAEHRVMRRQVALKVLPADDDASAILSSRFLAEVRVLAGLSHPHVVTALDAGIVPSAGPGLPTLYFLALELVSGGDVEEYLYRHGPQPIGVACEWGRQVAGGLRAAHDVGLVHRDLKPSNLVLTDDGRVKIVDFGLMREYASTRTPANVVLGSLDFVAPEQLTDPTIVGPPADVYSLGVVLFWVLTGQLPVPTAASPSAALAALQTATLKPLRSVAPDLPPGLTAFVDRMLARNPADRPTTAEIIETLPRFAADSTDTSGSELDRMRETVADLEPAVRAAKADAESARAATLTALEAVAGAAPGETPGHIRRVREYTRELATNLGTRPEWAAFADPPTVETVARCAAVHDLGRLATPDDDAPHTVACDTWFDTIGREHPTAVPYLRTLRAIVRGHHENWDGTGFPDKLSGSAIPHSARIVAVAVAYDDLRRGTDCPSVAHADAVSAIRRGSRQKFDPVVVDAFVTCATTFEQVFATIPDVERRPDAG